MSDTEYTPTMEQLRMAWIEKRWNSRGQLRSEGSDAEFDRAIAAHDAELTKRVRAEQRKTDIEAVMNMEQGFVTSEWGTVVRKLNACDAIREASDE